MAGGGGQGARVVGSVLQEEHWDRDVCRQGSLARTWPGGRGHVRPREHVGGVSGDRQEGSGGWGLQEHGGFQVV